MDFLGGFFETFLEGSVDHIVYKDYIVNRRFFIYCGQACGSVVALSVCLIKAKVHQETEGHICQCVK